MTKIEWATHTVNWLAGCTKVSPACTHCYAETMSRRQVHMGTERYRGTVDLDTGRWTGVVRYDPEAMRRAFVDLRSARKPRRVFCNSMSDTFHKDAPPESLDHLAEQIRTTTARLGEHRHVIMLLTKRPSRLLAWQREHFPDGLPPWVWVGTTVEDQRRADERAPVLLEVKTQGVRFLSCEPLLGPVDLTSLKDPDGMTVDALRGYWCDNPHATDADGDTGGIRWVIAGGESGRGARPMHPAWARSLRDQCTRAGVPFFFKQWGAWGPVHPASRDAATYRWLDRDGTLCVAEPHETSPRVRLLDKAAHGRTLDGRTWDDVPTHGPGGGA